MIPSYFPNISEKNLCGGGKKIYAAFSTDMQYTFYIKIQTSEANEW